jgi:hypothetical protein
MGMHLGLIAADCDWSTLRAALARHCEEFTDIARSASEQWLVKSGVDDLYVGERDGRCYVLDPAMVLSADSDLIVAIAHESSCLVAAGGAETVSGTFWFTAADGVGLRRVHFDVASDLTEPFDVGVPLSSEGSIDWRDMDGAGILARFADLGFSPSVLMNYPPHADLRVVWSNLDYNRDRPLSAQIGEHCRLHRSTDADDWMKRIEVVPRGGGQFDIRSEPPAESRRGRFFRRRRV